MSIRLIVRNCRESCRHYLKFKTGTRAICCYEDASEVVRGTGCKYELLTENSARKFYSSEERVLRDTFGAGFDITITEAREQLAQSRA